MIVSAYRLLEEIKLGRIIKNLDARELNSPEGVGFDLRIGTISSISGMGALGIETRRTGSATPVATVNGNGNVYVRLEAGKTYLATTIEEFDLPEGLVGMFYPRSTLFRSGVVFQSSILPYGYCGPMTFALTATNPEGFELQLGARFAHVILMEVSGPAGAYKGQWQGGRIAQPEDEEQI